MKQKFITLLFALFALTATSLIVIQIVQTNRTLSISDNLFNISVSNAMDDVIEQLDRLKVEDYISQKDRYKLLKYKRAEDLNTKMQNIVRENATLFSNEEKISLETALQDSATILPDAHLTPEETGIIERYNTLLDSRNKLTDGSAFYDQFVNELSEYIIDNIMSTSTFNYEMLDTMIVEKLIENGIDIQPTVGIVNAAKNNFLYCSAPGSEDKLLQSPYRYSFHPNGSITTNDYYIVLLFPQTVLFLKNDTNKVSLMSFLLILIIFIIFVISFRIILNQKKLDEMKNDFISNMTHEIKTPLATISLACEMLQDPTITDDATTRSTYLGIIGDENRRMRILVETILQSSKMSNKHFAITIKEVDMHQIIENVTKSFQMVIKSRHGELHTDLQASPSLLYADELHITNMVYNLIDNAIKYSPETVDITILTRIEGDNFVLSVADHGLGISKEDQKHIFEKFYRVSTGNVHNVKGFGIGLNYVLQVVQLHKGKITVESELNKGTTFTIHIPTELQES